MMKRLNAFYKKHYGRPSFSKDFFDLVAFILAAWGLYGWAVWYYGH